MEGEYSGSATKIYLSIIFEYFVPLSLHRSVRFLFYLFLGFLSNTFSSFYLCLAFELKLLVPMPLPAKPMRDSDELASPSNNLWVGNLAPDVTDADLMELFAKYGALDSVTTYSARSYAFIYFKRVEDAKAAKNALQGTSLRGSSLKIEFARPVCLHLFAFICSHNSCIPIIDFVSTNIFFFLLVFCYSCFLGFCYLYFFPLVPIFYGIARHA